MKRFICALLAALMILTLCACGGEIPANGVFTPADLSGKRVGALTGTAACSQLRLDETITVMEFATEKDLRTAVRTGVIDGAVIDGNRAEAFAKRSPSLTVLETPLEAGDYSIITARENADLQTVINDALLLLEENKTLEKIIEKYIEGTDYVFEPVGESYAISGTVTLAVAPEFPPYVYHDEEGNLTGLDVDVARAVCDVIGLKLEFVEVENEADLMSMVQKGAVTMAMGRFSQNEENEKLVLFSTPYYSAVQSIVVRKK